MVSSAVIGAMTKLVAPTPLRFFYERLDPGFVAHDPNPLQQALEEIVDSDDTLRPHAYAVVDLTVDPRAPVYAGWNDTGQREIASLAKLLPLYGAFKLRAYLRGFPPTGDLPALAHAAREHYGMGAATDKMGSVELPWIEEFLTSGAVDFKIDPNLSTDGQLDSEYDSNVRLNRTAPCVERNPDGGCKRRQGLLSDPQKLKFELQQIAAREQLRLMAGWSDDVAACVVIKSLGFPYLWALSRGTGLYRQSGWDPLTHWDTRRSPEGGLFLGATYNHLGGWDRPAGVPRSPLRGGNARSLAVLMTCLAQDRLVDPESDAEMREMLRRPSDFQLGIRGERSPIGIGMRAAGWAPAQPDWGSFDPNNIPGSQADLAVSKIGWEPPKNLSNAVLVRAKRRSVTITAVLVALNNVNDAQTPLAMFGKKIANALDVLHP
jgi:Beta-lactamase enzyme family